MCAMASTTRLVEPQEPAPDYDYGSLKVNYSHGMVIIIFFTNLLPSLHVN